MKQCTKCYRLLSFDSFNKHSRSKSGLRSECKECQSESGKRYASTPEAKAKKKAWNESPIGKLISRLSDQKRNKTEKRRKEKRELARTPHYRILKNKWIEEYRKKEENKPKLEARYAVRNAIRHGDLKQQPCEYNHRGDCFGKINAHHDDYSKQLDVRWLCARHHKQFHLHQI